jgi:hypothetical protein
VGGAFAITTGSLLLNFDFTAYFAEGYECGGALNPGGGGGGGPGEKDEDGGGG